MLYFSTQSIIIYKIYLCIAQINFIYYYIDNKQKKSNLWWVQLNRQSTCMWHSMFPVRVRVFTHSILSLLLLQLDYIDHCKAKTQKSMQSSNYILIFLICLTLLISLFIYRNISPSSSMVRTLISCIKNENSNFSSGSICFFFYSLFQLCFRFIISLLCNAQINNITLHGVYLSVYIHYSLFILCSVYALLFIYISLCL